MAAPDVSAVVTLCNKAHDLRMSGHHARSFEYEERALAAAQALTLPADCLLVARLHVNVAGGHLEAVQRGAAHDGDRTERWQRALDRFCDAGAILMRRKEAGTLMEGCTAAEVAWATATETHVMRWVIRQRDVSVAVQRAVNSDELIASLSQLMGYRAFVAAASFAAVAVQLRLPIPSPELRRDFFEMLADACELMRVPRPPEVVVVAETNFVKYMRALISASPGVVLQDAAGARLLASWHRLERSGVLRERGIDRLIAGASTMYEEQNRNVAAAAAAPGLRSCAHSSCSAREVHPNHFKTCAACRSVAYCSKEHQTADWPSHKAACKATRKAAPERAG
jgi:hypothetical protein